MSLEQASQQVHGEPSHHAGPSAQITDLPPVIQRGVDRLGPGDGEGLKALLRQYPELTNEIVRASSIVGMTVITRSVDEVNQELARGRGKPPPRPSREEMEALL